MNGYAWLVGIVLALAAGNGSLVEAGAADTGYPKSIEEEIKSLLAAGAGESSDPVFLIKLSDLYLDAGEVLYTSKAKRLRAYQEGARYAQRVIDLQERNADGHYLYAANLGGAAQLKGVMASAFTVTTLKKHARRAVELDPEHAAALHMMGMLLEELPGFLGGDSEEALRYLRRSVQADPTYTHARLNLAKAYLERDDTGTAKKELRAVLEEKHPRNPYTWAHRHKPEAQSILASLKG